MVVGIEPVGAETEDCRVRYEAVWWYYIPNGVDDAGGGQAGGGLWPLSWCWHRVDSHRRQWLAIVLLSPSTLLAAAAVFVVVKPLVSVVTRLGDFGKTLVVM